MRTVPWLLLCVAAAGAEPTRQSFDGAGTPYTLSTLGDEPGAAVIDGALTMLNGRPSQQNVMAFERTAAGPHHRVEIRFRLRVAEGADGAGIALLDTARHGVIGAGPAVEEWEEPNLPGCFGLGIDVYNPPGGDPFNALGNIYDRPQREVSLHWDGLELHNALAPVEFRGDAFHDWAVLIRWAPGGAFVTVAVDGVDIYRDAFLPGMAPYESRLAVGARTGGLTTTLAVDEVAADWSEPGQPFAAPTEVTVFDGAVIHSGQQTAEAEVDLPAADAPSGRVLLTLSLGAPEGGIDPWDRGGTIWVVDGEERIELVRFITPFGRPYVWQADVTDYQHLLHGRRRFGVNIGTWVKGWTVGVKLSYHPGRPPDVPVLVRNLWVGDWEYGNPEAPLDARFEPRELALPEGFTRGVVRVMVTGHGMHPATNNAGEFMPADRTVTVNGTAFGHRLWREDCYLNPCRPQGGTWKYDRAGWAPGSLCRPWDIDASALLTPGGTARITYLPMPYVNEQRGQARASHLVSVQLILYRATQG